MLCLAVGLALLIALPQLIPALRYYPHSIRSGKSAAEKHAIGNVDLRSLITGGLCPWRNEQVDGVFYPEVCWFIGWPAMVMALWGRSPFWWTVLVVSLLLAMGKHTPIFRWTAWAHLRVPARYTYVAGVAMAMLAFGGTARITLSASQWVIVTLLQCASLCYGMNRLLPMRSVQRWERPSRVFDTPLVRYLQQHAKGYRVSGLPYPLRTGQAIEVMTLGYNGGSQAKWMARLRQDSNPTGSGSHDWLATQGDSDLLDWYGVKYAYTYRPLTGKWIPTPIPHLYENTQVQPAPRWEVLSHG